MPSGSKVSAIKKWRAGKGKPSAAKKRNPKAAMAAKISTKKPADTPF